MYRHTPGFLSADIATEYMKVFEQEAPWTIWPYSPNSRLVAHWDGNTDTIYGAILDSLRQKLITEENVQVEGVFMNLYKNGSDYCPHHRDQYGLDAYTLSLGATRDFLVKPDGGKSEKYTLRSGDLYYMNRELHLTYTHSIPKRTGVNDTRVSLVFFTNPM